MANLILDGDLEDRIDQFVDSFFGGLARGGFGAVSISAGISNTVGLSGPGLTIPTSGPDFLTGTITSMRLTEFFFDNGSLENEDRLKITDISVSATSLFDLVSRTSEGSSGVFIESAFETFLNSQSWTLTGGEGDDSFAASRWINLQGNDLIYGGDGSDEIHGETGNDTLHGDGQADTLYDGLGDDLIFGGAGDDIMHMGGGFDTYNGGSGRDTVVVDLDLFGGGFIVYADLDAGLGGGLDLTTRDLLPQGQDSFVDVENYTLLGFNDAELLGSNRANVIRGGDGDNTITGRNGDDSLFGGDGGINTLYGGNGADSLYGGSIDNLLYGGRGADYLIGASGINTLRGAGGADTLIGGFEADSLYGGTDHDVIFGDDGADLLQGAAGRDGLYAGNGDDILQGGSGDDTLVGDDGNDILTGGKGSDTLYGDGGNDTLSGGVRADTFIIQNGIFEGDGFGNDIITDFNANSAAEKIDFSAIEEITDFADLAANHMAQVGADVVITRGVDTLTLLDVDINKLDDSDFLF